MTNEEIAEALERAAALLAAQHADHFRVRAYERAADTCRTHGAPLRGLDRSELESLPGIGKSIASSILELAHTGRLAMLDRLSGQVSPEDLFTTLPGIGDELAHRIHDELGVETLEELETAAHDGRLEQVPGIGRGRATAIRNALAAVLSQRRFRRAGPERHPDVEALLAVDEEYRAKAAAGALRRIAPRRFNPKREAWLPVLHTAREGWFFTALFSNSARAHRLGATRDWVVIVYEQDGDEGRCTVVTEHRGALAGRRVVRGRESECARLPA